MQPIIDAHLHFANRPGFVASARRAGHENTPESLSEAFARNGIVLGVAMGSGGGESGPVSRPMTVNLAGELDLERYNQPDCIAYCTGIDTGSITRENLSATLELFERHLRTERAVGLKIYAGYQYHYVSDEIYHPFYELAQQYDLPVVIHTGDTANPRGLLKYSHPLTVDEAAVRFPKVRFVMAHYGNPWIVDATEVAKKNPNVFLDLSGLAEGQFSPDWFCEHYRDYLQHLHSWLTYLGDWDKVLYGSDWPLVNIDSYVALLQRLVPEVHHEQVFFQNALRVFPKLQQLPVIQACL